MQDNEFRHKEHARVRSADSAVIKAVEHEAALERKAERKEHRTQPEHRSSKPQKTRRVSDSQLYGIKKRHKGRVPLIILLILVQLNLERILLTMMLKLQKNTLPLQRKEISLLQRYKK